MPENLTGKAMSLLSEGKAFGYKNFCEKGSKGYPASFRKEYIAWKTRVEVFISSTFGKDSPIYETFKKCEDVRVLGNGPEMFRKHQDLIFGALEAAAEISTVELPPPPPKLSRKVFIVHGHDEGAKHQLEILLRAISLEPVVLHREADEGLTIIEKFEKHSDVGYAFILLTPDDVAYRVSEESKQDAKRRKEKRARQNVIFEFGYFVARLGRKRVCCLYKEGVTLPTDVSGIIYKQIPASETQSASPIEQLTLPILKDLRAAGYDVIIAS